MKFSARQRFWTSLGFFAAGLMLLAGVEFFMLREVLTDWTILSQARRDVANAEERRKELSSSVRYIGEHQDEYRAIRSSIVDPGNPLPFIESLEDLGRRYGIRTSIALASPTGKTSAFDVTVEGAFDRISAFIRTLESIPFAVEFGDFSTEVSSSRAKSSGAADSGPVTVRTVMSLTTVSLP